MSGKPVPEYARFCYASDDMDDRAGIDEYTAWENKILAEDSVQHLGQFVGRQMGHDGPTTFVSHTQGSYNVVFRFRLAAGGHGSDSGTSGRHVALRVPRPGHTVAALMPEKIENEVHWMQYFEEHAIAKVPHVYSWSASWDNDIGQPFILMDFMEGESLNDCLIRWLRSTDPADRKLFRTSFEQVAALYLSLDRHRFDKIGCVTRASSGAWAVTRRPLTHDMHDTAVQLRDATSPMHGWPTGPLRSAAEYQALVASMHSALQNSLRTINVPASWHVDQDKRLYCVLQEGAAIDMPRAMETARTRILSRYAFAHPDSVAFLQPQRDADRATDPLPFAIFNPDLGAQNILVDPKTAHITALIDFEYTNAMPAALARDPPLFLLPYSLEASFKLGTLSVWIEQYRPAVNAFLGILEDLEKRQHQQARDPPLSKQMRESFESMQWLVRLAYYSLDFADAVFCEQRHLLPSLDEHLLQIAIQEYQDHTKRQIALYEQELATLTRKK
ncbi:Protein kinase-like domain protein [Niveomyces insectorum RCEF 264]|uniref:Protein kinase-like domain protein n=1 Tax=Niveomyces insectorum RCEF 264 TaxID=1081102 RepID=A0A167QD62_9HYPO|nr:Protein kinase-like domain protein [Niveomyces insectorum RCEF 264]